MRRGGAALNLHEQTLEDARVGRPRALEVIDLLAASGAGEDMFMVLHGRWLGHAYAGHAAQAKAFQKRVRIITDDDVWRRKAYLFFEAELYALSGDLIGLGRTADMIAEVADMFEGWRPWLAFTHAAMHRLRGELAAAKSELEIALQQAQAGQHRAWLLAAPAHAEILLLLGDAAGAIRAAEAILSTVKAHALHRSAEVAAERILALAQSHQREHAAARASVQRALTLARELAYGGLPLALLYEAQAQVSIAAGDPPACVVALKQIWQVIEHADAPALINGYETLREESAKQLASSELPALSRMVANATTTESSTMYTEVHTRLTSVHKSEERAAQSLQLLLEDSGAQAGHLLLLDANGLFYAASVNHAHAGTELIHQAQQYLDSMLADAKTITQTDGDEGLSAVLSSADAGFAAILLANRTEVRPVLVGMALLAVQDTRIRAPRTELVRVISQCLLATGNSVAIPLND
jgi:hypothetical protein